MLHRLHTVFPKYLHSLYACVLYVIQGSTDILNSDVDICLDMNSDIVALTIRQNLLFLSPNVQKGKWLVSILFPSEVFYSKLELYCCVLGILHPLISILWAVGPML